MNLIVYKLKPAAAFTNLRASERCYNSLIAKTQSSTTTTAGSVCGHSEFAERGATAWRLFNAVTEIAKEHGGLWQLPARTTAVHGLLDQAVGLLGNN